ncbi:MAG: carboxypeptidase M32 [Clostridiales bacterium]|nr:carboxypeptidase M32 [Clostridiales bacterium]
MNISQTVERFKAYTDRFNAIHQALNLFSWDMAVGAPKGGTESRAKYVGILSAEEFSMRVSDEMKGFLDALEPYGESLDEITKAMLRICRRYYYAYKKIPVEEMREYSELLPRAEAVWEKAREENDFASFAPILDRIIRYQKKFVEYRGYEGHPYNTLLDDYEPGMTVEKLDVFFNRMKEVIVPLLKRIAASDGRQDKTGFVNRLVPVDKQRAVAGLLMKTVGFDLNRGMLKESAHPFTNDFGKNDVRITTHYHENAFLSSFYSVLHECGHAIYEQNKMDTIADTILDTGISMGVHESQSRFYENIIGRSEAFWEYIYNGLMEILGDDFKDVSARQFYEAANVAKPSLIRIEADELTYCLHIMVRYEIEKQLFSGDFDVNELPGVWNAKMREYLGVEPAADSAGILQDIHWSDGSFGYFPSYAIGNAYAAQILHVMRRDIPVENCVRNGDFKRIQEWLTEKIHRFGSLKTPSELMEELCGETLNAEYYAEYLTEKFSAVYNRSGVLILPRPHIRQNYFC